MKNELTELALDLRALAAAEIEREFVLSVRTWLQDGEGDPPDGSLFGLSLEEVQALVLEVLAIECRGCAYEDYAAA